MHKYLLITILLFLAQNALGQNRATIKGKVTDSVNKAPIEFATIAVLNANDTTAASLINYKQSDKEGLFSVPNVPVNTALKLIISFVGYKPYIKFFSLIKGQTMDVADVRLSPRQLNEVVVKAERMPIRVSKDTVEFDATAFKVRPNAVVEDLLKKLPGLEVDNQGKITVMGKAVSKILVDGRKFFATDPRIASKNLDAEMIAKVQVYDDREDDPHHLKTSVELNKVINLKFKKALKKSVFGKVYAGHGTRDFYQAGGLFNAFRDTLQLTVLGGSNNLNSTGFDYQDLSNYGGLNRGGEAIERLMSGMVRQGKQTTTSGGANINTNYPKTSVNLSYLFKHANSNSISKTNRQQFVNDTITITNSANESATLEDNHNISATLRWAPDTINRMDYQPVISITKTNETNGSNSNNYTGFNTPVSNEISNLNSFSNYLNFEHSLDYYRTLKKKGSSLDFHHHLTINNNKYSGLDFENLISDLVTLPSYNINRLEINKSNGRVADASI